MGQEPLASYRDLVVWQKAMDLVVEVYELSRKLPDDERFGLTSQMRRAAVSIPANVAEGYGRTHRGEYLHHVSMANGSLKELETHLIIAGRLSYFSKEDVRAVWERAQEIGKMLRGLMSSLAQS